MRAKNCCCGLLEKARVTSYYVLRQSKEEWTMSTFPRTSEERRALFKILSRKSGLAYHILNARRPRDFPSEDSPMTDEEYLAKLELNAKKYVEIVLDATKKA